MDSITLAQKNNFFKRHKLALIASFIVGLIALAPHIIFPLQLGKEYKGIYMMQTANETEYLARIKEVTEGNWKLGSVPFYEYKNNPPLMAPNVLDFLYAGAHFISGISISNLVIASKLFLPPLFFFLIYFLIRQLTRSKELLSNKINAIAGGLLIVLGYDLVDYGSLISYIRGVNSPSDFLLWTRPINPILGGMLIFGFLLIFWKLYKNDNGGRKSAYLIFSAGLLFALAIMSYFFSWGIILSFLAVFGLFSLFLKNWLLLKRIVSIAFLGILFSAPYLYNIYLAAKNPLYKESAIRTGIFYGRELFLNKFLILALLIFAAVSLFVFYAQKKNKENLFFFKEKWWLVCLAIITCGFIALNQQLLTGQTVWPYHFVQYTIPLGITALFATLYNFSFYSYGFRRAWMSIIFIAITAPLSFGSYTQSMAYKNNFENYKEKQKYAEVFEWINSNTKEDCVILTSERLFLTKALTIYTKCDTYLSDFASFVIPTERLWHNYLVYLRIIGIGAEEIDKYVEEKNEDILTYLYAAEPMAKPEFLIENKKISLKVVDDYKEFLKKDFLEEVKKYNVTYLMTEKNDNKIFSNALRIVYKDDNLALFEF